jgi:hypothetical protein
MVNREANAAAFAALGGSKIGMKRPFASNGAIPDWKNGLQNQGLGNGLTGTVVINAYKYSPKTYILTH